MTLETTLISTGVTITALVVGWLARGAKTWFTLGADVLRIGKMTEELISEMKEQKHELVVHVGDTRVHIVPDRDEKFYSQMLELIRSQFDVISTKLDAIDSRCNERLAGCQARFALVEQTALRDKRDDHD